MLHREIIMLLKNETITVASAGTRQRLITDPQDANRYVQSVMVEADKTSGTVIYVGDESVSATVYASRLSAGDSLTIEAPLVNAPGAKKQAQLDLYNIWVDAGSNGHKVHISYLSGGRP